MALVVEDGSIVSGANTYISRNDFIAYALARGVVIADDDASDVILIKAMDYLAMLSEEWRGKLVEADQSLAFPRDDLYVGDSCDVYPNDAIPSQLIKAQAELGLNVNAGTVLTPTLDGSTEFVTREKVDVIETEYSEAIAMAFMGMLPQMPLVSALLRPLLKGGYGRLRSYRI